MEGPARGPHYIVVVSAALAGVVLVVLLSVAGDEPGFMNAPLVVGGSAFYQLVAGFYLALVADLSILSLSAVTLVRMTRKTHSRP